MSAFEHAVPNEEGRGISRRTVVIGAAWTLPVIATATAVPLASASGEGPTVETGERPLVVGRCTPATGITFLVTENGQPVAGELVVVTIPSGWSWTDGTAGQTVTLTSDSAGVVRVPSAQVNGTGGTATITAQLQSGGQIATTIVPVSDTVAREVWRRGSGTQMTTREMGGIPEGSTAIAWNVFLGPNGDLYSYHRDSGYALVASNVTSVDAQHYMQNPFSAGFREIDMVTFVSGGVAMTWTSEGGGALSGVTQGPVPSGTRVVGWNSYLYPNGELYKSYDLLVATGVTSATVQHEFNSDGTVNDYVNYVDGTGAHTKRFDGGGNVVGGNNFATVPAGSTVVGWNSYLAPNGTLYYMNEIVATGVVSVEAQHTVEPDGHRDVVTYVTSTGAGATIARGVRPGTTTFTQNYGANATVVGSNTFLTADGSLYHGNELLDTGVVTADSWRERGVAPELGTAPSADWIAWTVVVGC